ncbi:MAG: hypothetical protein NC092_04385 [Butyrivibrio sp.]|nr:hypothetical protein [Muribaculum sp.]MCM1551914.1 hypothetical protein [Butyrivibrio sp.]
MKVRVTNQILEQKINSNNRDRQLLDIVLGNKTPKAKRDTFVRSNNEEVYFSTYAASSGKKTNFISKDVLAFINNNQSCVQWTETEIFLRDGRSFAIDQIPHIDTSGLQEIKAEGNCIDFGVNKYFKYVSKDGGEHYLYTDDHLTGSIFSEYLKGEPYDGVLERYSRFWNYIGKAKHTTYIAESFSLDEVKSYLEEAGIQPGFFTVKMGDTETTRFYTTGEYTTLVYTKERYDEKYESLTKYGRHLCQYEPGSVFKINGNEYVLSENHTLDIPYGEDIFVLDYPENYRFGEKIY